MPAPPRPAHPCPGPNGSSLALSGDGQARPAAPCPALPAALAKGGPDVVRATRADLHGARGRRRVSPILPHGRCALFFSGPNVDPTLLRARVVGQHREAWRSPLQEAASAEKVEERSTYGLMVRRHCLAVLAGGGPPHHQGTPSRFACFACTAHDDSASRRRRRPRHGTALTTAWVWPGRQCKASRATKANIS